MFDVPHPLDNLLPCMVQPLNTFSLIGSTAVESLLYVFDPLLDPADFADNLANCLPQLCEFTFIAGLAGLMGLSLQVVGVLGQLFTLSVQTVQHGLGVVAVTRAIRFSITIDFALAAFVSLAITLPFTISVSNDRSFTFAFIVCPRVARQWNSQGQKRYANQRARPICLQPLHRRISLCIGRLRTNTDGRQKKDRCHQDQNQYHLRSRQPASPQWGKTFTI